MQDDEEEFLMSLSDECLNIWNETVLWECEEEYNRKESHNEQHKNLHVTNVSNVQGR